MGAGPGGQCERVSKRRAPPPLGREFERDNLRYRSRWGVLGTPSCHLLSSLFFPVPIISLTITPLLSMENILNINHSIYMYICVYIYIYIHIYILDIGIYTCIYISIFNQLHIYILHNTMNIIYHYFCLFLFIR